MLIPKVPTARTPDKSTRVPPPSPGKTVPAKPLSAHQKKKARAQAKAEALRQEESAKVEGMPVTNRQAAGIDIGDRSHWVCVGFTKEDNTDLVKELPAHTEGLRQIVAYLRQHKVTTVTMESTGIYWVPLFELLQSEQFEVFLVDPSYTSQIRGRPKTDRRDAQWIFRLHSCGMLAAAFRPDEQTVVLRSYLRQRGNLTRYAGKHVQHMQKALQLMNLKLTNVLSDITGATGRKIITAILAGERDPLKLALLRNVGCKKSVAEIAKALDGSYRVEHLFCLQQAFEAWQFYQQQIGKVDAQIEVQLKRMKSTKELPEPAKKPRKSGRKQGAPQFDVRTALYYVTGIDLTELEGLDETSALILISEIGTDMSKFETVKHFCSWLGLCPNFKKTGGKVKSSRVRPGCNRAAQILRLAVLGLDRGKGALGAFLRRMKGRMGKPAAITATAHKLARMVYYSLKHGIQYVRQSQQEYEEKMREKQIAHLQRKARQLGFELKEKVEVAASAKSNESAEATKADAITKTAAVADTAKAAETTKTTKRPRRTRKVRTECEARTE